MNRFFKSVFFGGLLMLSGFSMNTQAQSDFELVYNILQTNCSGGYCHGGGAGGFYLTGDEADYYSAIVDIDPQNLMALNKGDKLIMPGRPQKSFLNRKINQGLHKDSWLEIGAEYEDSPMPSGMPTMAEKDREIIRQWILFGAKQTGNQVNEQAIEEFYTDGGIGPLDAFAIPSVLESEGFQIHFGPIFLEPNEEVEFLLRYDLQYDLDVDMEVNRLNLFMDPASHHFILYKYNNPNNAPTEAGLRNLQLGFDSPLGGFNGSSFVAVWQENEDIKLPEGTAYSWGDNHILDLNFHVVNYSQSLVAASDVFLNVYTQPDGIAEKEMISDLLIYGIDAFPPVLGQLPVPANSNAFFTEEIMQSSQQRNLWMLSSHTHKFGTDFDIFLRESNGSKGMQVFEGFFNSDYTLYDGVYDYAHPPIRYFDKFLEIKPNTGLIHEAKYTNTSNQNVNFGLTTNDEMMITVVQYTTGANHQTELSDLRDFDEFYCLDHEPIQITNNYESGAIGNGVIGNYFYPDFAGVGTHQVIIDCCDPVNQQLIEFVVADLPDTPEIAENGNELSTDDGFSYQWYLDGTAIPSANASTITVFATGDYQVEITNGGGCTAISDQVFVTVVGIEEIIEEMAFAISPNPYHEYTNISFQLNERAEVQIQLYDMSGKMLQQVEDSSLESGNYTYPLEARGQGVYLLNINVNGKTISKKIIEQ